MSNNTGKGRFRVIFVGGGLAGVMASHVLQQVKIDHVVLEGGSEVAPPDDAGIAIYPHGSWILQQTSCLEAAKAMCILMEKVMS